MGTALDDSSIQRRLATIVAIDVAGYSARTEVDKDAAAADVAELGRRIETVCAAHGGRVVAEGGDRHAVVVAPRTRNSWPSTLWRRPAIRETPSGIPA